MVALSPLLALAFVLVLYHFLLYLRHFILFSFLLLFMFLYYHFILLYYHFILAIYFSHTALLILFVTIVQYSAFRLILSFIIYVIPGRLYNSSNAGALSFVYLHLSIIICNTVDTIKLKI